MSTCLTCSNSLTCTSCDSTLNRFLNTTQYTCDCIAGYYANSSNLCAPCGSLCTTCNSSSTCLTCKPNLNRTLDTNNFTCGCNLGYILISSTNICLLCQSTCLTCITNYTNRCGTCDNSTLRSLNSTSFQCQCPTIGYFDDGINLNCLACSYTCYTCSGSAIYCTACPTGSNRAFNSSTGTCYCAQHFYDANITFVQNSTCLACSYYCSTCLQPIACTSCNSSKLRAINTVTSKCICLPGSYDDGIN